MSEHINVQCPQPSRPLKRKASELDPANLKEHIYKRPILYSPSESITNWLRDIPPVHKIIRSRSDSFLLRNMSGTSNISRPGSAQPNVFNEQPPYQPPSPLSLAITATSMPPPAYIPPSPSLRTASLPSSVDQQSLLSRTSTTKEDSKKSQRVKHPAYRDDLASHHVYIDSYGMSLPDEIRDFAQKTIEKARGSPLLSDQQTDRIQHELSALDNADEETTRTGYAAIPLFPKKLDYEEGPNQYSIAIGANLPFDRTALPVGSSTRSPPIVTPSPDFHYGFPYESFNDSPAPLPDVLQHPRLHPYAKPTTAAYWPFFAVEFKSQSRLGSRWVAANQNAGTGSHCVNSIETLLNNVRSSDDRNPTDSVAFSCIVDSDDASLWVHWRQLGDRPRFTSSEIGHYHLHRKNEVQDLRSSVRNIIDFGLEKRLPMIKDALYKLIPQLPRWDEEVKALRARLSSQLEDV